MSIFKKTFISLAIIFGLAMPILAMADQADRFGIVTAGETAGLKQLTISTQSIPQLAGQIVGVGLSLVGIIFFLLMLYAGIRWMIAMGKSEDVQKAKDTLEAAAIGLVIVLAAYAITQFVFTNLGVSSGGGTGTDGAPAGGGAGGNPVCFYECSPGEACQEINDPSADLKVTMSDTCNSITDGPCADVPVCAGTKVYCLKDNACSLVGENDCLDDGMSPFRTENECDTALAAIGGGGSEKVFCRIAGACEEVPATDCPEDKTFADVAGMSGLVQCENFLATCDGCCAAQCEKVAPVDPSSCIKQCTSCSWKLGVEDLYKPAYQSCSVSDGDARCVGIVGGKRTGQTAVECPAR